MRIDIATTFPDMCNAFLNESIIGRARAAGLVEINCKNIRDYTLDRHNKTDDTPYGGGKGMIMAADPVFRTYEAVCGEIGKKPFVVYMSPEGRRLDQSVSREYLEKENIFIICGHYEGLDERVIEEIVDEEISLGDFVLTGGELPALCFADSVVRMISGVLAADECFEEESHYGGLLEYAQYTKPMEWHGRKVPDVLLSGNHAKIAEYRHEDALRRTRKKRPDMYRKYKKEHPEEWEKKRKQKEKEKARLAKKARKEKQKA